MNQFLFQDCKIFFGLAMKRETSFLNVPVISFLKATIAWLNSLYSPRVYVSWTLVSLRVSIIVLFSLIEERSVPNAEGARCKNPSGSPYHRGSGSKRRWRVRGASGYQSRGRCRTSDFANWLEALAFDAAPCSSQDVLSLAGHLRATAEG